ncbi:MAG: DUF6171 family protein [Eubacterium sp.]
MSEVCKRCLLLQSGEADVYETVKDYIDNLEDELKVSVDEYNRRLSFCRKCDFLISGMCLKCGCYVEIRAVLKEKSCPDANNVKWTAFYQQEEKNG